MHREIPQFKSVKLAALRHRANKLVTDAEQMYARTNAQVKNKTKHLPTLRSVKNT